MGVIQASKLIDRIDPRKRPEVADKSYFSNSETNDNSDKDSNNQPGLINKIINYTIKGIEELREACIESKYARIVKSKRMTLTIRKLQEVHANLWGLYKPASISEKNDIALLLDEFTHKSWILILRYKKEMFDTFKLWLLRIKANRS